jgi:chromosome segregation ATPase
MLDDFAKLKDHESLVTRVEKLEKSMKGVNETVEEHKESIDWQNEKIENFI